MRKFIYEVKAPQDVVEEMARYDEAEFERLAFVRLGRFQPITDEQEALDYCRDESEQHSRLVYRWRLSGNHPPTIRRWRSFGVRVEKIEEEEAR